MVTDDEVKTTSLDPYTNRDGLTRPAPRGHLAKLRFLGPGIVITGSIVGSGELILTSSLGAAAGISLLWWLLICCWSKSLVQAEFARYVVTSGDTYLRALNRVPGRFTAGGVPISWTVWLALLAFIPGTIGMGGILGGAGLALSLLVPGLDPGLATGAIALTTSLILFSGSYRRLERLMIFLVAAFTVATLVGVIMMQQTTYELSMADLGAGLVFDFPVEHLALALAVYGATGVNASEISTYSYWCIEKGYPGFVGSDRQNAAWLERARGWLGVLHLDIWLTLLLLTCATLPFFLLGAGVLHREGLQPDGLETVSILSTMFTNTLGSWSLWLFGGAAFCILFSSAVAGFGGTARFLPDFLIEFGLLERHNLEARRRWIAAYGAVFPLLSLLIFLYVGNPVLLLMTGALMGVILLPVQSGATLWLQRFCMDVRVRPTVLTRVGLWFTFVFQLLMAILMIVYVVLPSLS